MKILRNGSFIRVKRGDVNKGMHKFDQKRGCCTLLEGLVSPSSLGSNDLIFDGFTLSVDDELSSSVFDIPRFSFYSYSSLKPKSFE